MDIELCVNFIWVGFIAIGFVTLLELSSNLIRVKLGLDKDYYIVVYKCGTEEELVFKTNGIKIDIPTKVLEFKDCKTGKTIKVHKDYTYKEVSRNEWLYSDNKDYQYEM